VQSILINLVYPSKKSHAVEHSLSMKHSLKCPIHQSYSLFLWVRWIEVPEVVKCGRLSE
jgi:hypothetical protein